MDKRQYRVKEGQHFEGDRTYKKGEIVTSEQPLDKLFANKFEVLGGDGTYVDEPEGKVVIDGGRSGHSNSPVDQSATVADRGGHTPNAWVEAETNAGPQSGGTSEDLRGPGTDEEGGGATVPATEPKRASASTVKRATAGRR